MNQVGAARPVAGARRRGRLSALELAEAVVMGDLTLAFCLAGHLVPLASVLFAVAVVPMAAVAARHRVRAVIAGGVAASALAFLIGAGLVISVASCAVLGALVGFATRRAWGIGRTVLVGVVVLWPPAAAAAIGALYLLNDLRRLLLAQVTNSWKGTSRTLRDLGVTRLAQLGDEVVRWATRYWWVTIPIALLGAIVGSVALSWLIARPTLRRVRAAVSDEERLPGAGADVPPAPVPLELHDVAYQYDGATRRALDGVSLAIQPGELVAIVGPNGSGKSTLARILVGREPTGGTVMRTGPVGLGRRHGSAIVFQRPEAQVLGVRVRDDIVWGLSRDEPVNVDAILEQVGLAGLADRDTSTLSGGELQRLAVGAALARAPQLFVSDESTSMVDPAGRDTLVGLLRQTAERGVAVVHVTHRRVESAAAGRVLALEAGRPVPPAALALPASGVLPTGPSPTRGARTVLELRGVGHTYGWGTPWATRALDGVDLELTSGEGVLVLGHNGSGKSTLAWILAGLLRPSEGHATLDGEPVDQAVGRVGLAFQHARLQLLRSTVARDVAAAAGAGPEVVAEALASVGLDPAAFAHRRVDELSGGEMRRVALAGIVARHPDVIVLDEPFAGLDDAGGRALGQLLRRLRVESGITVVVVSHDDELPEGLISRVVELAQGRVVRDGPVPDLPVRAGVRP